MIPLGFSSWIATTSQWLHRNQERRGRSRGDLPNRSLAFTLVGQGNAMTFFKVQEGVGEVEDILVGVDVRHEGQRLEEWSKSLGNGEGSIDEETMKTG